MKERCNECPASVHLSKSEIEDEVRRVVESGVPLTKRDQYEKRLDACNNCDQFVYGTTCMSCGCIVKVRALNALRICPHVSGSRW